MGITVPFECDRCDKLFSNKRNKKRHIISKHLKLSQECEECHRKFSRKDVLAKHIQTQHNTERKQYTCDCCHLEFREKRALLIHIKSEFKFRSTADNSEAYKMQQEKNKKYNCVICRSSVFFWKAEVISHLRKEHNVQLNRDKFEYPSETEFYSWKKEEEEKLTCGFRKIRTVKLKNYTKIVFVCCRSGNFNSKSKGKRRIRLIGSKKINGYCPAEIVLYQQLGSSVCKGTYTSTHVGHAVCDERGLVYMNLNKNELDEIFAFTGSEPIAPENTRKYALEIESTMQGYVLTNNQNVRDIALSYHLNSNRRSKQMSFKLSAKMKMIRHRHRVMERKKDEEIFIEEGSDGTWLVPSFRSVRDNCIEMHIVTRVKLNCENCPLICDKCFVCVHVFKCSCADSSVKNNMCKHIHFLVMKKPCLSTSGNITHQETCMAPESFNTISMPQRVCIKETNYLKTMVAKNDTVCIKKRENISKTALDKNSIDYVKQENSSKIFDKINIDCAKQENNSKIIVKGSNIDRRKLENYLKTAAFKSEKLSGSSKTTDINLNTELKKLSDNIDSILKKVKNADELNEVKKCVQFMEAKVS